MLTSLTLPALAFLMAISGIPGLNALPGLKRLVRHKPHAAEADSLPPPWKSASRLALEHYFIAPGLPPFGLGTAPIKIVPTMDPRQVKVRVDPDSGIYVNAIEVGDLRLGAGYRAPLAGFGSTSMSRTFRDRWMERSRRDFNVMSGNTPVTHTGLSVPIPVSFPTPIQSILGPGGPALNVSGSESIRLSGTSNWTNQTTGVLGQRKSLFPSLDMQQDLNIQLEGQLSDRVKVNMLQNSANQVPLANRIAINYRGDEDDLIQALDLGNTNLALPGTQYVSYSGRNEGLFGVKLASRLGPLDFTALASKQEGRSERASYSGGASRDTRTIADFDYAKGQYFLLYDPSQRGGQKYEINDQSIEIYRDDGNYGNDITAIPRRGRAVIDPDRAFALPLPPQSDSAGFRGVFDKLVAGPDRDYEILPDYYLFQGFAYKIIRLRQAIPPGSNMCLAAIYKATPIDGAGVVQGPQIVVGGTTITTAGSPDSGYVLMKMLRAPRSLQLPEDPSSPTTSFFDPNAPFEPIRELELKNFYNLQGFGIDPGSFKLAIQRGRDDPPHYNVPGPDGLPVEYIEILGLDNVDESVNPPAAGHDHHVDGTLTNAQGGLVSSTRGFVDYKNGVLFFPEPRPFAPRNSPTGPYFDRLMSGVLNRRLSLTGARDSVNGANPNIYDRYIPNANQDPEYYIVVEYAAQRAGGDITLGRGNVLEGSDVVTVNGERWKRDTDYTIDYDLGRITLKRQLGPTDQLNIDYSYAPLFQQAGKTLVGSAFRLEGRDRSVGGAFLYESKGAQDLRPRLGEEPSRTLITDVNTDWHFRPSFITRMANALPGVRTTTPSDFNVQAEAGASFPNPNTRNEVFIDDMEGVRDAVSLSLSPEHWRPMSVPHRARSILDGTAVDTISMLRLPGQHNAEIHWYLPPNKVVKDQDLKPTLTDAQGAQNPRTVLALSVPRYPHSAQPGDSLWTGLTYPLDQVGIDLTRSQFIELWLDDFRDRHRAPTDSIPRIRGRSVKMHIDLGVVSEDQMRAPNRPPNGKLDTEDLGTPPDRQLTVTPGNNEDTGYDQLVDVQEQDKLRVDPTFLADLSTASDIDPEGDDWHTPNTAYHDIDPRKFAGTNGTEGNKTNFPYPDTEDLNLDDLSSKDEAYYEYTIDLGDGASPYLVTDVWRDFASRVAVAEDNGWRRYRIPISDTLRVQFGIPDLSIARHVRIWFEGLTDGDDTTSTEPSPERKPIVMIGGLDIVGSRWQSSELTDEQKQFQHTTMTLNSVNTLDNADIYSPPFDPGETRNGSQALTRREQSMSMEFTELAPDDTLEAYRTFSLEENYSRYGILRWYATGFDIPGYDPLVDSLYYFVRFASDEQGRNYYEVKRRMPASLRGQPVNWEQVKVSLEQISNLKLAPGFPPTDPILYRAAFGDAGDSVIIKGRPSFTRLRRISFGIINAHAGDTLSGRRFAEGQLWFDELRATDIAKDVGYANRLLVSGHLANLASYNVSWNSRDADFLSVGESRGTGSRTTGLAVTTQFDAHRFFEGTGIQLPMTMAYNRQSSKPRFSAGDDVVRTGEQQAISETRSDSRSFSMSYSRTWNERSNPFLRYTVGGLTGNINRSVSNAFNPSGTSQSLGTSGGASWTVSPRKLMSIGLPYGKTRIFPLPDRVYWNYQVSTTHNTSFARATDGSGALLLSSDVRGRAAGLDFGADSRPIDAITHHIDGHRVLNLDGVPLDHIGFVNFGRLTSWRQNFGTRFALQRGAWVRPTFSWTTNYGQNNDTQSPNLSVRQINNGQNVQLNWDLPFDQLLGVHTASGGAGGPSFTPIGDTTSAATRRAARRRLGWRDLVARIGGVQTDASVNRSSSYSRLTGTPSLLYLVGLAENPGLADSTGRMHAASGNTVLTGLDWRTNARTRLPVAFGSTLAARFSYGDRTGASNGVVSRTHDMRFPDFEVDYGHFADAIRLSRFLLSPQLRTAWSHSTSTDYQGSRTDKTGTSKSDDLHPLLSLRGNLKNGTTADLSVNVRNTKREVFQFGTSTQTDNNTDLNLTLSRSYSQGQKVNFLGKTSTVRSSVSLQLATVYSHRVGETKISGNAYASLPVDETRLSMTGTGTYGFSSNVNGSAVLGFSNNNDRTRAITRRSVRVELRAQFTF